MASWWTELWELCEFKRTMAAIVADSPVVTGLHHTQDLADDHGRDDPRDNGHAEEAKGQRVPRGAPSWGDQAEALGFYLV